MLLFGASRWKRWSYGCVEVEVMSTNLRKYSVAGSRSMIVGSLLLVAAIGWYITFYTNYRKTTHTAVTVLPTWDSCSKTCTWRNYFYWGFYSDCFPQEIDSPNESLLLQALPTFCARSSSWSWAATSRGSRSSLILTSSPHFTSPHFTSPMSCLNSHFPAHIADHPHTPQLTNCGGRFPRLLYSCVRADSSNNDRWQLPTMQAARLPASFCRSLELV